MNWCHMQKFNFIIRNGVWLNVHYTKLSLSVYNLQAWFHKNLHLHIVHSGISKKCSNLQSNNLQFLGSNIFIYNLQYFGPKCLQPTSQIWAKSTFKHQPTPFFFWRNLKLGLNRDSFLKCIVCPNFSKLEIIDSFHKCFEGSPRHLLG